MNITKGRYKIKHDGFFFVRIRTSKTLVTEQSQLCRIFNATFDLLISSSLGSKLWKCKKLHDFGSTSSYDSLDFAPFLAPWGSGAKANAGAQSLYNLGFKALLLLKLAQLNFVCTTYFENSEVIYDLLFASVFCVRFPKTKYIGYFAGCYLFLAEYIILFLPMHKQIGYMNWLNDEANTFI